jgi:lipopolysaccharide transport system permease protein
MVKMSSAVLSTSRAGPLFYLAGTIIWNYFADCLTKTSTVFRDNSAILDKVYFPRLIMPLSIIVSNLIRFGVQFLLFILLIFFTPLKALPLPLTYTCCFSLYYLCL